MGAGQLEEPLLPRADEGKSKVQAILDGEGPYGSAYNFLLTIIIVVNVASFVLSTEPGMHEYDDTFSLIEATTVVVFSFEYIVRLASLRGSCLSRIWWALTNFFSVVDLLSILPFYVDLLIPGGNQLIATQWIRVLRLLRLLPPLPYAAIWRKSYKLLTASGFAGLTIWVLCAALYYFFERDNAEMMYCPDDTFERDHKCWNRFRSIPVAMYYSLLNFFGEFPLADNHSLGGRFVGGFIQVMGAAVMAIPAGALGNAFSEVVEDNFEEKEGEEAADAESSSSKGAEQDAVIQVLDGKRSVVTYELSEDYAADAADLWFALSLFLVACSMMNFVLGTLKQLPARLDVLVGSMYAMDMLATAVFLVEYIFRISRARAAGFRSPVMYMCSGFGIIDGASALLPVAAYFRPHAALLRALGSLRVLKLERYIGAFSTFKGILWKSRAVLGVTGGAAAVLWVVFSTLMYYAERDNPDPDMAKYYSSVGTSMWVTLLNLSGEAPLCEYTEAGKYISAIMGLIGVGFVTIPMGVLGQGFQDMLEDDEDEGKGEDLPATDGTVQPETFRTRVHKFLQGSAANQVDDLDPWEGRAVRFEYLIFFTIFVTVVLAIMETVDGFAPAGSLNRSGMHVIETVATLLFSVEYCLRYFAAPEEPSWAKQGYTSDSSARFAFVTSAAAIIDLLAIAPFYFAILGSSLADEYDGELRMLRIFRLLTLDKYIPSVSLIGRVFANNAKDFTKAAYASTALWLIFSALLWLTERHDPTKVDDLTMSQRYGNMPRAMPYTLVHLTGDYPLIDYDFPAKCVLFFALLFAVGVVSVPTGLLASGFTKELEKYREEERRRRRAAASKIEKVIKGYLVRRRFKKTLTKSKEQSTALGQLHAKTKQENPEMVKVIGFLEQKTPAGRTWKKIMLVLIILNVLAVIFESVHWMKEEIGSSALNAFETASVIIFTLEYAANVWSAKGNIAYKFRRREYMLSFFGIVDLVTVAPFWIQTLLLLGGIHIDAFLFRIARLLRILQLEDFVESFTLLDDAWRSCRETMVATGFMALLVWVCGSVLFYEFEQDNPRMEGAFKDLPSSMYYTVIFLGGEWAKIDFTPGGQIVCVIYCVVGIGLYGIPIAAVFEAFSDVLGDQEAE
eukprot:TRINITY_DN61988_c0_g1_i1.p1 TRINITY_DN61988_c0_g1~~TRINITY_DN61988_c0_g1_i1.p1  ORF type:complete len:1129 (-),score=218.70 TRINITY_DN61988_c0_g1_i1:71-3457(-)